MVLSWTAGQLESICVHLAFQPFHLSVYEWWEEERGMLFWLDYWNTWNWSLNMVNWSQMCCLMICDFYSFVVKLIWTDHFILFWSLSCVKKCSPRHIVHYMLQRYERCQITTWGHDPSILSTSNLLLTLQECLSHSAVLVQTYSLSADTGATRHLSFPLSKGNKA